ncbi:hypothetical protein CWI36_0158p0040, partial [Hamiltosporidium magnivora]
EFTTKEKQIYTLLQSKLVLEEAKNTEKFFLDQNETKFSIKSPKIYSVPDTDTFIVFGDLKPIIDLERLRQALSKLGIDQKIIDDTFDKVKSGDMDLDSLKNNDSSE